MGMVRSWVLVDADKKGTTITCRLKMSVLEDALLGFAETFGFELKLHPESPSSRNIAKKEG